MYVDVYMCPIERLTVSFKEQLKSEAQSLEFYPYHKLTHIPTFNLSHLTVAGIGFHIPSGQGKNL